MSTNSEIKIKRLIELHVPGTMLLASWLNQNGFSHDLQQRYRKSDWLESVGVGAFKRPAETVSWQGGLYSLQKQLKLQVHVGGLTALAMSGFSHYLRTDSEQIYLFSPLQTKLPNWFKKYFASDSIVPVRTSMLTTETGLIELEVVQFQVTASSPERAILEALFLAPDKADLLELYQVMSGLVNLRPDTVQNLLEKCTSIKVKRLFLYMARKLNHQWFQFLDLSGITLGSGDRKLVEKGVYNAEFGITIPKELYTL
ncbi:MAG: type IV toxin-antitoxin system AbiEi family antitoxin [Prolixibacteraceae bacterium]|nr:type IV toxin-antitoxin system AbiEi family antitoxin [Prolixibacteraceae bacterium]